jgi:hypothetical protein
MRSDRVDSWRNRTTSDRGSSGHRGVEIPRPRRRGPACLPLRYLWRRTDVSILRTWSAPSSRRCATTSTICRRLHRRPQASIQPSLSVDARYSIGRARAATWAGPVPITTTERCTHQGTLVSTARTRHAPQTRRTAPRLCVGCGSTRHTSTTAAQLAAPPCAPVFKRTDTRQRLPHDGSRRKRSARSAMCS